MARTDVPDGRQEQLFLVSPDQSIIEPTGEVDSVNIAERAIHLGQALDHLAQANMRDAFAGNEQARQKYGGRSGTAAEGAIKNAAQYRIAAKWAYMRAYGATDPKAAKEELQDTFELFTQGIGPESKERKSIKQIREELHRALVGGISSQNRLEGKRPHKAESKPKKVSKPEDEAGLPTREKLISIAEDPRAGFITPTNHEKNLVMTYLDYLDNPAFELGPQNQLIEVANFQLKHHGTELGTEYGDQAGRSIAYVFADFYEQASKQLADLEEVAARLHETNNPNLSLALAMDADILKAIPLIRYMDLVEYRATGEISYKVKDETVRPAFDVLRSKRNEAAASGDKNKVIEDPYTAMDRSPAVTKWLKKRIEQIKVGDVRELITDAILDQQRRQMFHEVILKDFAEEKTGMTQLAEARKVARRVLDMAA